MSEMRKRAQGPMVMMPRRSCFEGGKEGVSEGGSSGGRSRSFGMEVYEEATDPFFDDGEVGGEDGEPGHEGQREGKVR